MYVDPGDWLPLIGVGMLAVTTVGAIAGAWAFGRTRGMRDALQERDETAALREKVERMEATLTTVAEEIERLGEVQRFALKVISDRVSEVSEPPQQQLPMGRVNTPH
jgi:hypothetical protein